jgi:hypothetical protein
VVVVLVAKRTAIVSPDSVVEVAPRAVVPDAPITVVVVVALPLIGHQAGSLTGVRKTMMQTHAAKQAIAMPSALPLC